MIYVMLVCCLTQNNTEKIYRGQQHYDICTDASPSLLVFITLAHIEIASAMMMVNKSVNPMT